MSLTPSNKLLTTLGSLPYSGRTLISGGEAVTWREGEREGKGGEKGRIEGAREGGGREGGGERKRGGERK